MAKWLATDPKVLILDEPTRGVDIGAKEIIHEAIAELAVAGSAVILITSDLLEMVGLSDRAMILRNGHITGELLGLLAGACLGLVNGFVIGKLHAHPIIWTMAFNFVVSDIVRWIYGGNQINPAVIAGDTPAVASFFAISRTDIFGVPIMVVVMLLWCT